MYVQRPGVFTGSYLLRNTNINCHIVSIRMHVYIAHFLIYKGLRPKGFLHFLTRIKGLGKA